MRASVRIVVLAASGLTGVGLTLSAGEAEQLQAPAQADEAPAPTAEALGAARRSLLARHAPAIVRVHDVLETVRFLQVWDAVRNSQRRLL